MTNAPTLVSIIMPVKNAGSYLHECLSSIRRQTFSFWELIIINDHSTDNTADILNTHSGEDKRIHISINQGSGIIPALQLALSKTKGEFITRMDGDDLMPENKLALMVEALSGATEKTVVTAKVKYFSNQAVSEGYQVYEQWLNERIDQQDHWKWVYRECVIASPNWMTRKSDLIAAGGFDGLEYPEDYHLVLKWHQHDFKVISLSQMTLNWREHPDRTSRNSEHYDQTHFFRLKIKHFVENTLGNSSLVLWGAGDKGRLTAQILDELKISFQWMDLQPEKYANGVQRHDIQSFKAIENLTDYKLLIAVFPPDNPRMAMEKYLEGLTLSMGTDYWYL